MSPGFPARPKDSSGAIWKGDNACAVRSNHYLRAVGKRAVGYRWYPTTTTIWPRCFDVLLRYLRNLGRRFRSSIFSSCCLIARFPPGILRRLLLVPLFFLVCRLLLLLRLFRSVGFLSGGFGLHAIRFRHGVRFVFSD